MARRIVQLGLVAALALPLSASAEAPRPFAKVRDQSQAVESLGAFLERYVGTCTDLVEKGTCEANAKRARAEMTGKLFYAILGSEATRMLKPGPYNPGTREFTIEMTPFFQANGLALTDGQPEGQDPQGRPRIRNQPIVATLPPDWMPMDMERLLRTQNLKIHLVFKPIGLWTLGKGDKKVDGVKAKFVGVRLTEARTGDDIALKMSP